MNAQNATQNPKNDILAITLKATYRFRYLEGFVGEDSTRTVADTFFASSEDEIKTLVESLVDRSFRDVMERMNRIEEFAETPSWIEKLRKKARKTVLDATWGKLQDGFSAKVVFKRGNAPGEFNHHDSEVAGIPTSLEISVSRKEDEDTDGGKKEQRLDALSALDVLETMDKIVQTLKFATHYAKCKDDISRSDMFDYIDDLKTVFKNGFKNETKAV